MFITARATGESEPCTRGPSQSLLWRHNERDGVLNHQLRDCLLNRLFRRRSKKTWKFRVTGLCARNSPVTGEFPVHMASNAENVSIWWRHHDKKCRPTNAGNLIIKIKQSHDRLIFMIGAQNWKNRFYTDTVPRYLYNERHTTSSIHQRTIGHLIWNICGVNRLLPQRFQRLSLADAIETPSPLLKSSARTWVQTWLKLVRNN